MLRYTSYSYPSYYYFSSFSSFSHFFSSSFFLSSCVSQSGGTPLPLTLIEETELLQDCIASLSVLGGHVDAAYPLCPVLLEDSTCIPDNNMSLSAKLGSNYGVISRLLSNDMVEVIVSPQGADNTGVLLVPWDKIRALSRCPLEGLEISPNLLESLLVLTHLVVLGQPFMCYFEGRGCAMSALSSPPPPLPVPSSLLLSGPFGDDETATAVVPKHDTEWQSSQLSSSFESNEILGSGSEGEEYDLIDAAIAAAAYSRYGDQSTDDIPGKSDSQTDCDKSQNLDEESDLKDEVEDDKKDDSKLKKTETSGSKDKSVSSKSADTKASSDRVDSKGKKTGNKEDVKDDKNAAKKDDNDKEKGKEKEKDKDKEEEVERKEDNMKLLAHFLSLTASKALATLSSVLPVADRVSTMLTAADTGRGCLYSFSFVY
jgi:hypothetical protein